MNGCDAVSDTLLYQDLTGLTEFGKTFLIYPNPASDKINILNQSSKKDVELKIFDDTGKLIYKTFIRQDLTVIPMNDYAEGIYFIQLSGNEDYFTKKILRLTEN
jgi:hypothetical protein